MSNTLSKIEWEIWCKDFGEANQTKIVFCLTHDLNYHQFLYWFQKLNKCPAKLIPAKMASSKQPLSILRHGNGRSLEVVSQDALLGLVRDSVR